MGLGVHTYATWLWYRLASAFPFLSWSAGAEKWSLVVSTQHSLIAVIETVITWPHGGDEMGCLSINDQFTRWSLQQPRKSSNDENMRSQFWDLWFSGRSMLFFFLFAITKGGWKYASVKTFCIMSQTMFFYLTAPLDATHRPRKLICKLSIWRIEDVTSTAYNWQNNN